MRHAIAAAAVVAALGCCKMSGGDEARPAAPAAVPASEAPAPGIEPVAAPPPAPGPQPAAKQWQRTGEQPGMSKIKARCADEGIAEPEMAGKPQDLGDGRYVSVVFDGESETAWALLVSEWEGDAQVEGKVQLPLPDLFTGMGTTITVAAREKNDFDSDGELEAWLVVRYETEPEPAVGGSTRQDFIVLDLDPELAVAFQVTSKIEPEADTAIHLGGKVGFDDVSGDGHPDVVFKGKECMDEEVDGDWEQVCEKFERVWTWVESEDAWRQG